MKPDELKKIMKAYGITYADMGRILHRSPATVKQRLDSEHTFHKHEELYRNALNECIMNNNKIKAEMLKEIGE